MKLRLSPDLELPLDAVTQTFAVLANRGAGKTYTGSVFAEELLKAGQQIVVIDPLGVWWGLRSSADGKSAGFPIIILGGEHADVPLEETGGKLTAKFIVDSSHSAIVDLSHLRKNPQKRFMVDFAEELYHLNRTAMHVLLDEADAFAPQMAKGDERLLGAISDWVRRGRARGIGVSLITQRSAVINKDVLELAETLIVLRTGGPRNIDAVMGWVAHHGVEEQAQAMLKSLPSMPNGDAWVWSPSWLSLFTRTHIRERTTFDSSRTPKPGETARKPKAIAPVDLEHLSSQMRATAERAKAEDPRELRKRIAQLEAELKRKPAHALAASDPAAIDKAVQRTLGDLSRVIARRDARLGNSVANLGQALARIGSVCTDANQALPAILEELKTPFVTAPPAAAGLSNGNAASQARHPLPDRAARATAHRSARENGEDAVITRSQQRMLDAIAFFERIGIQPTRAAVAGFCAVSHTTGSYSNNLSALRVAGLIEDLPEGRLRATAVGAEQACTDDPPTLGDLHATWKARLTGTQGRMLQVLIDRYPDAVSREELATALDVKQSTGSFSNNLSKLRTLGLLEDRSHGEVAATTLVFPDGLGS